jgi:hypothetical protein
MDTSDRIEQAGLDAMQQAWSMGYRPCSGCGCWDTIKHLTQAIDAETGEPCWFCEVCVDRTPQAARHE